jgi:hypothetical protein
MAVVERVAIPLVALYESTIDLPRAKSNGSARCFLVAGKHHAVAEGGAGSNSSCMASSDRPTTKERTFLTVDRVDATLDTE